MIESWKEISRGGKGRGGCRAKGIETKESLLQESVIMRGDSLPNTGPLTNKKDNGDKNLDPKTKRGSRNHIGGHRRGKKRAQ